MGKKIWFFLTLVLILAVAGFSAAQYHRCSQEQAGVMQNACYKAGQKDYCAKHGGGGTCFIDCSNLPCPKMVLKHKLELGLTEDQVNKLKSLRLAAKKEKVRLKADIKIMKLEIADLLDQKNVDQAAVDTKIDQIAQLTAKCTKQCVQAGLDAKQILTVEQLTKLEALRASCTPDASKMPCQKGKAASKSSAGRPNCIKS